MQKTFSIAVFRTLLTCGLYVLTLALSSCATSAVADNLDRRSLTILGITPGESTFNDVTRLYGAASQWHAGDAAGSETKICFRLSSGKTEAFVVFASNAEMAGAPHYVVTAVRLYSVTESFPDASRCGSRPKGPHSFSTKSGISLGAPASKIEKILGKPHRHEKDRLVWTACSKVPLPETDPNYGYWSKREGCFEDEHGGWKGLPYYNACTGVSIGLKNAKVTYLEVYGTDSIC